MIEGVSQNFSNYIISIAFIDINYKNNDYRQLYDYIDNVLEILFKLPKFYIYCKKIPRFFINRIILLCYHFNTNKYKTNIIMERLVYMLYYYIQDRKNIIKLVKDNKFTTKTGLEMIRELLINIECIKPIVKNMLKLILTEIEDYINNSRIYTFQILNEEMKFLPSDIVSEIVDFMPELYVIQVSEAF